MTLEKTPHSYTTLRSKEASEGVWAVTRIVSSTPPPDAFVGHNQQRGHLLLDPELAAKLYFSAGLRVPRASQGKSETGNVNLEL